MGLHPPLCRISTHKLRVGLLRNKVPISWGSSLVSPHHESFNSVLSKARSRSTAPTLRCARETFLDGMWTEAVAVLIIALANVICYITHEKSLLHGHLRLPKVLFISNR